MSDNSVLKLSQPSTFSDPLTEVLRSGARSLLARAVKAEGKLPPRAASQAARLFWRSGFQYQGRSSCRRVWGVSAMRSRTSASQACGSISLSLAVPIRV